jgi:hypothetical protein
VYVIDFSVIIHLKPLRGWASETDTIDVYLLYLMGRALVVQRIPMSLGNRR